MSALEVTGMAGPVERANAALTLPRAANEVERHTGEMLPDVRVRIATPLEFAAAVAETPAGGSHLRRATQVIATLWGATVGRASGLTLATEGGGVLVLMSAAALRDPDEAWEIAVHELVHAVQMTRPGVHEAVCRYQRHMLGLEHAPRPWVLAYEAAVDRREDEAYEIQDLLTDQFRKGI